MDPATLYMIAACSHALCLPLEPHGFTMTKAECEAKALEMRLEKLRPISCLNEEHWLSLKTSPDRRPGPIAR